MKTRGRPRHPELLTPRQQEVWHLLRQGLTNEEIADRLGISLDGAKYHVSEVLRRLGVDNRYDAAELAPETVAASRPRWAWAAAPLLFAKKLHFSALTYAATGAALGAVAVGIALLAWGVTTSNDTKHAATADVTRTPIPRTGSPELDHVIDLLVNRDIAGLADVVEYSPVPCGVSHSIGSLPPRRVATPDARLILERDVRVRRVRPPIDRLARDIRVTQRALPFDK
jgi:DNA-binding CsgD family transcriptional regulator